MRQLIQTHHRLTLVELIIVIVVVVIVFAMFFPMRPNRHYAYRARSNCISNLQQIGFMLSLYSDDYDGYFPQARPNSPPHNNFAMLVEPGLLANGEVTDPYISNSRVWACPGRRNALTLASNSSYRYVGSGLKDDNARARAVSLAYDEMDNHPNNEWVNVLFVDGHVDGARPGRKNWAYNN